MKVYIVFYTHPSGHEFTPCATRSRAEYEASEILRDHRGVFDADTVCGFSIHADDLPSDILGKFKEWSGDHSWGGHNVEIIEEDVLD